MATVAKAVVSEELKSYNSDGHAEVIRLALLINIAQRKKIDNIECEQGIKTGRDYVVMLLQPSFFGMGPWVGSLCSGHDGTQYCQGVGETAEEALVELVVDLIVRLAP